MADTYTTTLGVILMGIGGDNNTWGTNLNNSVFQILEDAIANTLTTTASGGQLGPSNTLDLSTSPPPAGPSAARYAALVFAGAITANQTVKVPNLTKWWWVKNATSGAFTVSMQTPSGSPVAIPQNGGWQLVACDGANAIVVSPFNSAQAAMPNGSAAAPSFSFGNETGSGWYRAGTQDIRLAVAGADVLQVTGTGAGTPSVVNVLSPNVLQQQGAQLIPPGTVQVYDGIELPAGGWLWCDGSAVSRATYAALFSAITKAVTGNTHSNTTVDGLSADLRHKGLDGALVEGTGIATGTKIVAGSITASGFTLSQAASSTGSGISLRILPHGQGDGSTTFNVRDARGRALFGRDDLNGTAAGRITVNNGASLATTGGEETHALVTAEMPAHGHSFSGNQINLGTLNLNQSNIAAAAQASPAGTGGSSAPAGNTTPSVTIPAFTPSGSIASTGGGGAHNTMPVFAISNMIIKT